MKRVAIPIIHGKLSQYFGQCSHYQIFEINGNQITRSELEVPPFSNLSQLPEWASQQGITDIIAYKIDHRIISRFINNKINLFVGVGFDSPQALIDDYLNGRLKSDEKIIREITESIL
jgi:predicted Fe-Mo cluster-binding NifX family protein